MDNDELSRILAFTGVVMIVISLVIGAWVAYENRQMADSNDGISDDTDGVAFFYDRLYIESHEIYFLDWQFIDSSYIYNPAPGLSGFNFFILMTGATLILYSFYNSINTGDNFTENMARLGLLIMVISLILAAWTSYTSYEIIKELNADDTNYADVFDKSESMMLPRYLNASLVFLGPGLILFAIFKEKVSNPEELQKNLLLAGIAVLVTAVVLSAVSGFLAKEMMGEVNSSDPDLGKFTDAFKNRAFISQLAPYLAYLGLGLLLFPFIHNQTTEMFQDTRAKTLAMAGLICVILGVAITIYPAFLFHEVANEHNSKEGEGNSADYDDAINDYIEETAFCNWATVLIFLGFGLMVLAPVLGQFLESGEMKNLQQQNIAFFATLVLGMLIGIYVGALKHGTILWEQVGFFTAEYIYVLILVAAPGLMVFSWTQEPELFQTQNYLCSTCGDRARYLPYYESWYCESCEDETEPYEEERQPRKRVAKKKKHRSAGRPVGRGPGGRASGPSQRPRQRTPRCRQCQGPMEYIEQYDRWYCYTCKRYAPRQTQQGTGGAAAGDQQRRRRPQTGQQRPAGGRKIFTCPGCGKTAQIPTAKRPLKLKCSDCGVLSVLKK